MTTTPETASSREVLDPVCGMTIDPADAAGQFEYRGKTYYFCHQSCLDRFRAAPEEFLSGDRSAPPAGSADIEAEYTCPMDPGARRVSQVRDGTRTSDGRTGHEDRVDLSDAPRDRP